MKTRESKKLLTLEEIKQSFSEQTLISGQIIFADPNDKIFKVLIGQNEDQSPIYGILPFDEFSVQNFNLIKPDPKNPNQFILGKDAFFSGGKWINCYIISMNNNNIYISRKMTQTIEFYNLEVGQEVNCEITSLNHPYTFVDIGKGIVALNLIQDLSITRYTDVKNWFNVGDKFSAIITDIQPNKRIFVSRKAYFEKHSLNETIKINQILPCRIADKIAGGYFVEITPLISGIMDTEKTFQEGQNVLCYVKRITKRNNGKIAYHLTFCNTLD